MEHPPEEGESEEVTDINTYLANFNKEISDVGVVDTEATSDYSIPQINGGFTRENEKRIGGTHAKTHTHANSHKHTRMHAPKYVNTRT